MRTLYHSLLRYLWAPPTTQTGTQTDNVSILSEDEMALFSRNTSKVNAELERRPSI